MIDGKARDLRINLGDLPVYGSELLDRPGLPIEASFANASAGSSEAGNPNLLAR
jgi:hypothetical protein